MKKTLHVILSAFIALAVSFASAQNDSWTQEMSNGFGSTNNQSIFSIDGFNGNIYCGIQNKLPSTSPVQLWKSPTGNSGTFTQVAGSSFTPLLRASDYIVTALSHTYLSPGYMYLGTTNVKSGMVVYSSTDGSTWTKISKRGMGTTHNFDIIPDIVVFNPGTGTAADSNYIYLSVRDTMSGEGASVWRTLYNDQDSTHWKKVFDMTTVSPVIQQTTWLYVWGDTLYCAGQDVNRVSQLYQTSDGIHWKANTGAANGFGDTHNQHIACMAAYKGVLYATTMNTVTGGQVWKTSNGVTWTQVTGNAFGLGQGISELRRAFTDNGFLWVAGQWFSGGTATADMVWRTADGITWAQSNKPGFGVSTNQAGYPSLGYYNHQMYVGTYNATTGAQIWRTTEGMPVAGFTSSQTTLCQGDSVVFTDTSNTATLYEWQVNGTKITPNFNMTHTFATAGSYTVALVAYNDTMSDTVRQVITVNPTPAANFSATTVCKGMPTTFTDASTIGSGNITQWNWSFGDGTNSTQQNPTHTYGVCGTYTVTLTVSSNSGCSNVFTTPVTVNCLPALTVTGHDTIVKGQSDTLKASGASTYNWAPTTGLNLTSGGTVIATPTVTTTYTVTGVNPNGCSDTASITIVVNTTVSISTLASTSNYTIYPNPSNGTIYISGLPQGTDAEATISDIAGRIVYHKHIAANTGRVQLQTALPDGIYIVTIKDKKGNIVLQKQMGINR